MPKHLTTLFISLRDMNPKREQWSYYPLGITETSSRPAHEIINSRVDLMRTLSHEDEYGDRESERWRYIGSDKCLNLDEIRKMIDSTRGKAVLRLSNYQPSEY